MEIEIYPLPDWAERLNKDKELIPGTQLVVFILVAVGQILVPSVVGLRVVT